MTDQTHKSNAKTELKKFYDSSQIYLHRLNKHDERVFTPYINLCKDYLPVGSRILDVGCGTGLSSYLLAQAGFTVVGMDISEFFLSSNEENYKNQTRLSFKVGDASEMPFANQSFDAVCSYDLLEHVVDVAAVLKEMNRVTKNGGLVIVFAANHLDPVVHFKATVKWRRKTSYKPWESKCRITAFYKAISTALLIFAKFAGLNRRIYYLEPVLSNDEKSCGRDFDATWLINWFDIENILKDIGFCIEKTACFCPDDRIIRKMKKLKVPKAIQSFYTKMRKPCVILGKKP